MPVTQPPYAPGQIAVFNLPKLEIRMTFSNSALARALSIAAALVLGGVELLALQKARLTRWRLTHKEA